MTEKGIGSVSRARATTHEIDPTQARYALDLLPYIGLLWYVFAPRLSVCPQRFVYFRNHSFVFFVGLATPAVAACAAIAAAPIPRVSRVPGWQTACQTRQSSLESSRFAKQTLTPMSCGMRCLGNCPTKTMAHTQSAATKKTNNKRRTSENDPSVSVFYTSLLIDCWGKTLFRPETRETTDLHNACVNDGGGVGKWGVRIGRPTRVLWRSGYSSRP